mmetsp:Transcript_19326/g.74224  ORF Transcript_19326/g.74224 Transcript_19326/m.74224 type:complete len:169 (-) Transcript_19326:95-601(-)
MGLSAVVSAAVVLALLQFAAADCTLWEISGFEIGTYHSTFSKSYWCCEQYDTGLGTFCTKCCYMAFWPIVCVVAFFLLLCCCCCCLVAVKGSKSKTTTTYAINSSSYQPAVPAAYQQAEVYSVSSAPQMQYGQQPTYYAAPPAYGQQPAQPYYAAQPTYQAEAVSLIS